MESELGAPPPGFRWLCHAFPHSFGCSYGTGCDKFHDFHSPQKNGIFGGLNMLWPPGSLQPSDWDWNDLDVHQPTAMLEDKLAEKNILPREATPDCSWKDVGKIWKVVSKLTCKVAGEQTYRVLRNHSSSPRSLLTLPPIMHLPHSILGFRVNAC